MQTSLLRDPSWWALRVLDDQCDLVVLAMLHADGVFSWSASGVVAGRFVASRYSNSERSPRTFSQALGSGIRGACDAFKAYGCSSLNAQPEPG